MSEQPASGFDPALAEWLSERGPDTYALVRVEEAGGPADAGEAEAPPGAGRTGIARPGADLSRVTVQEVTRGQRETLRRWLHLDGGEGWLAIVSADGEGLREHTPGELAVAVGGPDGDAPLAELLAGWLYARHTAARAELGWSAAAAAWACHLRAVSDAPPPPVLWPGLQRAGSDDEDTAGLVVRTARQVGGVLGRLESTGRSRGELAADWRVVEGLAADVPALAPVADWLLDQIALRDAKAQRLRAVLEPDITDHLLDRRRGGAVPALDGPRAAQLAQAREAVRAYTAAAYSGRERDAQAMVDAFPVPARALTLGGPAAAWRARSASAAEAVEALAARRAAVTAEDRSGADPDLLHAQTAYLAAREAQLLALHEALGRLAFPAPLPRGLSGELARAVAARTQRWVLEAFGTPERAVEALEGQIRYQERRPVHRPEEARLLGRARAAAAELASVNLHAADVRARLQAAMGRRAAPAAPAAGAGRRGAHPQAHTRALAQQASPGAGPVPR